MRISGLLIIALSFVFLFSSCKKEESTTGPEISVGLSYTVGGKTAVIDTVGAIYDDSLSGMVIFGGKKNPVEPKFGAFPVFVALFYFDLNTTSKSYSVTSTDFASMVLALYADSTIFQNYIYATHYIRIRAQTPPSQPIGSGTLNVTSHNKTSSTIQGNFDLTLKQIRIVDDTTTYVGTQTVRIQGNFNLKYFRGRSPFPKGKELAVIENFDVFKN